MSDEEAERFDREVDERWSHELETRLRLIGVAILFFTMFFVVGMTIDTPADLQASTLRTQRK